MEIILSSLFKIELSINLNNIIRITNVRVQYNLFFDSALKDLSSVTVILPVIVLDHCGEQ